MIHFYGGEPLLHPQLIDDCLTYIREHYCDTVIPKIITNGTLHSPRVLDLLVFTAAMHNRLAGLDETLPDQSSSANSSG